MYFGSGFNSLFYSIQQESFIFILVFLIAFAVTYLGLVNFFTGTDKVSDLAYYRGKKDTHYVRNKGALILLSVSVGLLVAVGMTQNPWLLEYVGQWASAMSIFIVLIIWLLIAIPLFKALKANTGWLPAAVLMTSIFWGILYYAYNNTDYIYSVPYSANGFITFLSSIGGLIVMLIAAVALGALKWGTKRT
jgi:cation transporter-like permease